MKEDLIQFLWEQKFFAGKELTCTEGQRLYVSHTGTKNTDAGPDFFNARLKINDLEWAGNVEIHVKTSDWYRHKHQNDKRYENVILHVVYEDDVALKDKDGKLLPTLEIKKLLPPSLVAKHNELMQKQSLIPCQNVLVKPNEMKLNLWLERVLIERLEKKTDYINELLRKSENNFEQCFYQITARYFGQKINAQAFEMLSQNLPLLVIAKHKNNLSQIEALVLGTAGFFESQFDDEYINFLKKEYMYLKHKYNLQSLDKSIWKFARTRPANFPTVRLLQFALFIYQNSQLLSKIIKAEKLHDIIPFFKLKFNHKINLDVLHNNGQMMSERAFNLGESTIESIIINAVIPMLFAYGKIQNLPEISDKSLDWLQQVPAEQNSITKMWESFGLKAENAWQSQALIEQKNNYCGKLQCLRCIIGKEILLVK
jgi:hypothetical protein